MNISRLGASALIVASTLAAPAMAAPAVGAAPDQSAAASANGAPNAPGVALSKQVGDWTIQCTAAASPNPCEMTQGVAEKNSGQRLLTISFFYIPARDQNFVVMQVPLGVSISNGLLLKTDTFTSPKLPYHQCDRNGCYAELPIDKNTLQNLGTTGKALVQISDASRNYDLGLSLKGFADASNALVDLSKQRAKNPPPGDAGAPSVIK